MHDIGTDCQCDHWLADPPHTHQMQRARQITPCSSKYNHKPLLQHETYHIPAWALLLQSASPPNILAIDELSSADAIAARETPLNKSRYQAGPLDTRGVQITNGLAVSNGNETYLPLHSFCLFLLAQRSSLTPPDQNNFIDHVTTPA